jgi:hypothetical protein
LGAFEDKQYTRGGEAHGPARGGSSRRERVRPRGAVAPSAARARRGVGQAELRARGVGERINAAVLDKLEAVRRTRDQVELSAGARRANVAGAIASRQPVASGIHILDDVFTAGAASSARRSLEEGGCQRGASPDPVQDVLIGPVGSRPVGHLGKA